MRCEAIASSTKRQCGRQAKFQSRFCACHDDERQAIADFCGALGAVLADEPELQGRSIQNLLSILEQAGFEVEIIQISQSDEERH